MVFLELRRDSRVTTGNSGCLLCWPRQVQSSIRVAKESWGLLSSDCRANRPHLGWCPEANVPLQGRQGSRGCIPDAPGETGLHLEWKQRTPLCSRVATGISWSSLGGLKGVKPPEAFEERSRDWSYIIRCADDAAEQNEARQFFEIYIVSDKKVNPLLCTAQTREALVSAVDQLFEAVEISATHIHLNEDVKTVIDLYFNPIFS